jgi:hypothetical protein
MNNIVLSPPKLAFIVGTRAALAFGIALLVSPRLDERRRRSIGMTLVAVGALATIPAALFIIENRQRRPRKLALRRSG